MTSQKFKSKKDLLFQALTLGTVLFCVWITGSVGFATNLAKWNLLILLAVCGFLLWCYYGTYYELTHSRLKYNSGPIKGSIEIKEIKEVVKDKTLWVGLKPATARKGLIIKYRKYDEIYISPESNDEFISLLLERNDTIKITTQSKESMQ